MNIAMELHDSRILSITCAQDGDGEVLFHAVIYRSEASLAKMLRSVGGGTYE
jgi:hypothetical protein